MILDGWGISPDPKVSAIDQANTPFMDSLYTQYAHGKLLTHGMNVGLPDGQMGNSEVGHMNLGAGRIVYQDLARINKAVSDDTLGQEEAIRKAENTGIIFIDEIDKVAGSSKKGGGGGPDVSREGVQRDLLPIVEGSAVNTKYGIVNTDHILFIAAGAFHVAKPSDLIPELQGRFPIRVELNSLTRDDFYRILKEPKNSLTKQYVALVNSEDVSLEFTDEALHELADIAFRVNEEVENIGARRLHTVMSKLLNDILFDIPDVIPSNAQVLITKEMVNERLAGLVQNKDLSHFIL